MAQEDKVPKITLDVNCSGPGEEECLTKAIEHQADYIYTQAQAQAQRNKHN